MKTSFTNKQLGLAVACALALGFASGAARAQNFGPAADRELWNDSVTQVWKNGFGECWHSGFGPPPSSSECDPRPLAPRAEAAPQPAPYVAPAPAQAQYVAPAPPAPAPVIVPAERPRKKDRN
jgi:OmpA-OmpF porin, OOP family